MRMIIHDTLTADMTEGSERYYDWYGNDDIVKFEDD